MAVPSILERPLRTVMGVFAFSRRFELPELRMVDKILIRIAGIRRTHALQHFLVGLPARLR